MNEFSSVNFRNEIYRKGIHLSSLIIPVTFYFLGKELTLKMLIPFTLAFIIVDLLRFYHEPSGKIFYKIFRPILREHETNHEVKRLNGGSYVMIAATICMLIFPSIITIVAFSILIISDSSAALIGKLFGLHKIINSKSIEGSFAFFLTAILVVFLTPKYNYSIVEYFIGIGGAIVGTIVEIIPVPLDDNLTIPISIGFSMWIFYNLFLPNINLI